GAGKADVTICHAPRGAVLSVAPSEEGFVKRWMRITLGVIVGLVLLIAVVLGGGWYWAVSTRDAALAQTFTIPPHSFPIPFPLSDEEKEALRAERLAAAAAG